MRRILIGSALYSMVNTALAATVAATEQPEFVAPLIHGEIVIQGDWPSVLRTLLDTEGVPEWAANVDAVTVLAFRPPNHYLVRTRLSLPPPLADRELITESIHGRFAGAVYLDVRAAPDSAPPDPDRPRVTQAAACWQATPQPHGELRLRYLSYAVITEWLPDWLTSPIAEASVGDTLNALPLAISHHRSGEIPETPPLTMADLSPLCQRLATSDD